MTKPKHPTQLKGKASKLTQVDVNRIRELDRTDGQSVREMAAFYRVGAETIRRVLRGETWNDAVAPPLKSEAELDAEAAASMQRMLQSIAKEKERQQLVPNILKEMDEASPPASVSDRARALGAVERKP